MVIRRTKGEWLEIIEAFKESGKSMAAFSREYGINAKTLRSHVYSGKVGIEEPVKKRSLAEWGPLIDAQRNSGMKPAEWCRQHGIAPDTMRTAARRLKESAETIEEKRWVELGDESKISLVDAESNRWGSHRPYTHDKQTECNKLGAQRFNGIRICAGGLEIEADASYPAEKLSVLIERLAR